MNKKVRAGAVQMRILSRDKNLKKIIEYTKEAAKNKVDILCFPEIAFGLKRKPSKEEDLYIIKDLCKKEKIHIIINGYFDVDGKIYNRSYLIDDSGVILGYYDKIYLWKNELEIQRGEEVKVINTRFGKVGLSICWDMYFPDHIKKLKSLGAEMVFNCSYWDNKSKKEGPFIDYAPTVLSYLYFVFFIFVNCKLKSETSISQICAPYGKLSEIRHKEGLVFADLYPARIAPSKNYCDQVLWDREEFKRL